MSENFTNKQKKDYAKTLFLSEPNISQKELAERVGVSAQTVCTWFKKEKWEDLKTSLLVSKDKELARLYKQLKQLNDFAESKEEGQQFLSSKEADTLTKVTSAIRTLETEMNIADKMQVGREFLAFARQTAGFNDSKLIGKIFNLYIQTFRSK